MSVERCPHIPCSRSGHDLDLVETGCGLAYCPYKPSYPFPLDLVERVARAIGPGDYVDDSLRAAAIRAMEVSEWAAYRNFIEEVAGSCIPDYEEAKRDAQDLLALAKARGEA